MSKATIVKWLAVATAAAQYGLPQRTVYNWLKTGKLKSKIDDGATVVDPEGLAALASLRSASAKASTGAGNAGGMANGRAASPSTGELAAEAFSKFEGGAHPVDVVRDLKLPPDQVGAFYREWQSMKDVHAKKTTLESRVGALEHTVNFWVETVRQDTREGALASDVDELRTRLKEILIPRPDQHVSPRCRKSGTPVVSTKCIHCQCPIDWYPNPAS